MKKHIWAITYTIVLIAFTVYMALDTFVITRIYSVVEDENKTSIDEKLQDDENTTSENETKQESSEDYTDVPKETVISDMSYSDENISINITEYREYNSSIYVADIKVSDPDYLKTAFALDSFGKNATEKTSAIAERNDAILAINGDYYGAQERGYVLRNGSLYRETASRNREDLVIYEDGSFDIITEGEVLAEDLLNDGAVQILSFGPALVDDGNIVITEDDEVDKAMTSNPRTAIGIVDELHYMFIVSDGRTDESEGLSLYELAEFSLKFGVKTLYNLDGGGSSTMYFNGEIINNPTSGRNRIKERSVSDIVFIGY